MKYERKPFYMRLVAVLLFVCLALQYMPSMPIKTAEAADEFINYIGPDHPTGKLRNGDYDLSRYQYLDDGSVVVKTSYNYEPGRRTTYYTVDTIWSRNSSRQGGRKECYPLETGTQGVDWVYTGVSAYNLRVNEFSDVSQSTYTFSKDNIHNMLTTLFGELQPNEYYTVYMSEIFIRRERYEDGTFTDYPGKRYYNIDEVRAMAPWTEKTNEQFEAYYDIPLTFMLRGGQITIVYVDEDNGNAIIPGMSRTEKYIFGDDVTVVPEPSILVGGKNKNYTGNYGYGFGNAVRLDQHGYPETFEMTQSLSGRRVFLGYSASAAPPSPVVGDKYNITVIPVDMDNGKKEIPGASFTIEFNRDVEVVIPAQASYKVSGETLAYSGKWSVDGKSLSNSVNPIKPVFADFESDHKVYLGYKRGIPIPSPAPVEGTGTIKVVPVDMDNGNTPITSETKVILYKEGDDIHFDIDPTCTKGGEVLSYAEKYNISSSGTNITLSQSGYPRDITMGIPDNKMTLYVGYKRGIAPPVPSITPGISPTPAPIVTAPPLPTLAPVPPTATPSPEESKNTICIRIL